MRPVGLPKTGGRQKGTLNKRTRLREQNIREAEARAVAGLKSRDSVILASSMDVLDEAMKFFLGLAREAKELQEKGDNYIAAAAIAEKLIPFKHPRLATVKVGEDRDNPFMVRDGVTSAEIRAELIAMMMEARDTGEVLELPPPIDGVANRQE